MIICQETAHEISHMICKTRENVQHFREKLALIKQLLSLMSRHRPKRGLLLTSSPSIKVFTHRLKASQKTRKKADMHCMPILPRKKELIWRVTLSKKTSLTYIEEKVLKSQKVVVSSTFQQGDTTNGKLVAKFVLNQTKANKI